MDADTGASELPPPPALLAPLDKLVGAAIDAVATFYDPEPCPVDEELMRRKLTRNQNMKNIATLRSDVEANSLARLQCDLTSLLKLQAECVGYMIGQTAALAEILRAEQG